MTGAYYSFLKQSNFVVSSDLAYKDRKSGSLGEVDGVEIVVVPSSYMPTNTALILVHPARWFHHASSKSSRLTTTHPASTAG